MTQQEIVFPGFALLVDQLDQSRTGRQRVRVLWTALGPLHYLLLVLTLLLKDPALAESSQLRVVVLECVVPAFQRGRYGDGPLGILLSGVFQDLDPLAEELRAAGEKEIAALGHLFGDQ